MDWLSINTSKVCQKISKHKHWCFCCLQDKTCIKMPTIFLETPFFLFFLLLRIFDRIFDVIIDDPYLKNIHKRKGIEGRQFSAEMRDFTRINTNPNFPPTEHQSSHWKRALCRTGLGEWKPSWPTLWGPSPLWNGYKSTSWILASKYHFYSHQQYIECVIIFF